MKTSDFWYDLPEELIAQTPLQQRDGSRLLHLDRQSGAVEHRHFYDILDYLKPGDCLVMNDSRVLPARLLGHRPTGGAVEVLLLRDLGDKKWECLCKPGRKMQVGNQVIFGDGELTATVVEVQETGNRVVQFHYEGIFLEVLERLGKMPLPPYIKAELQDRERYQTVYARERGSAAAPTAGLHFTPEVLSSLDSHGIEREEVTLHVGAGTFKPVKSEHIGDHDMHTEHIAVRRSTIEKLISHQGQAIAVGTTSVRTLESLYYMGILAMKGEEDLHVRQWMPYEEDTTNITTCQALEALLQYMDKRGMDVLHSSTQIIIAPGYDFHIVKMMITNFHQPQSTLLLLVSAFVKGNWRSIYDYALENGFRFLSYGDSSVLIP